MRRLPDFLVVGQENWDEVERRNQLLVRALAARNPGARFLFAEIPVNARRLRRARRPRPERVSGNVFRVRTVRPFLDRFATLARWNDRLEARQLRRCVRELGLESPALWTQDPRAATLVDRLPVSGVVYDLTDDWAAFERDPARRERASARIRALADRADHVLACSRPLVESVDGPVEYVPNAVTPPTPAPVPADLAGLPRPLLGYVGTLHDARLDVELLAAAARLRPAWTFVLLGPDLLEPRSREALLACPNVRYLGVRSHAEVSAYVQALDVCLVPHVVTDFTRSLDPLKVYEYLAAGRPVVATPTGNLPEHVALARTAEELVAAAEAAEDTAECRVTRRRSVAGATWEARAEQVESVLGLVRVPATVDVTAVVVSYGTRDLLARCLTALGAQEGVTLETIVVDNASPDASAELVRREFPEAQLVALDENVGFARANNLAFEHARGEHLLLLNSDCFLEPGALSELVAAARRHPDAAAVGARLANADGSLQRSAWPFPRPARIAAEAFLLHRLGLFEDLRTWAHDEEREVDFLIGACLLVRRDALDEVGGFDERFRFYGEEADLQRRLANRGWKVVLAPDARATHVGGASSRDSRERLRLFYGGQRRYLEKHGGRLAWPAARLALLVGSMARARWALARVALDPRL